MLKNLPIGCISKSTDTNLDYYFCFVSVNVPRGIRAPIFPFIKENGGLIYPTGNWSGWYTSENLKMARDSQNVKIKVHILKKTDFFFYPFFAYFTFQLTFFIKVVSLPYPFMN